MALLFQHSSEDGTQDISRWVGDLHNAVDSDTDSDSAVRGTQWEPSLKGKVEISSNIMTYHEIDIYERILSLIMKSKAQNGRERERERSETLKII